LGGGIVARWGSDFPSGWAMLHILICAYEVGPYESILYTTHLGIISYWDIREGAMEGNQQS